MSVTWQMGRWRLLGMSGLVGTLACSSPAEIVDRAQWCGGEYQPEESWTLAASPADLGWFQSVLDGARGNSREIGSDVLTIFDRGWAVAEWTATVWSHHVQSVRKRFLNALFGIDQTEDLVDAGHTIIVFPGQEVVVVHRVDEHRSRLGWGGVYALFRHISGKAAGTVLE